MMTALQPLLAPVSHSGIFENCVTHTRLLSFAITLLQAPTASTAIQTTVKHLNFSLNTEALVR